MNINPYIYLGAIFLVSPLVFFYWSMDFDNFTAFLITTTMFVVLYAIGVLLFNYLQNGSFFKFSLGRKWELINENVLMDETILNPILGIRSERKVYCDVYRKRQRNGMYKYKTIPRC